MNRWGVSPCYTNPPVAKADRHDDTNTHNNATESYPHPPNPPRPSGVTNVGPTTAIATHTQPRRTIVPKAVATSLTPAMHQGPTSRRCGHARRRSTPTPGDAQTTHKARAIVVCALRRPTCPQCNAIEQHQAGMQPQQRKHNGDQSTIRRGHTRPTTSQKKEKRRGA